MEKVIDYEGYNLADNIQLQGDGSVICRLSNTETGKETILGFPSDMIPFELTEEEKILLSKSGSIIIEP